MNKNKFSMNDILLWNFFGKKSLSPIRKHKMEELKMEEQKDTRYREPKGNHKADDKLIKETIENTQIYNEAKEYILKAAQPEQVGYGIDKYPEPLNADTWSIIETIDHIISESVDKLHYLVMLRIKMLELNDAKVDVREYSGQPGPGVDESKESYKTKTDIRNFNKDDTDCHIKIGNDYYDAKFIEIFQYSDVIGESPMLGGHRGGVVSYPVAVVRHGAILKQVKLSDIKFKEEIV